MKIIHIDSRITIGRKEMEKRKEKIQAGIFQEVIKELNWIHEKEYTPKQASKIADRILKEASVLGYNQDAATPIIQIIENFGINAYKTNNLPGNISGIIHVNGPTKQTYKTDKVIFTNENEPFEHQRFVLAHELGHYLFDCLGNPEYKDENCLFTETYPKKDHNSKKEIRADRFAAELLMPHDLFIQQYIYAADCEENNTHSHMFIIMYLSKFFQVKMSSVKRRINEVLYDGGY